MTKAHLLQLRSKAVQTVSLIDQQLRHWDLIESLSLPDVEQPGPVPGGKDTAVLAAALETIPQGKEFRPRDLPVEVPRQVLNKFLTKQVDTGFLTRVRYGLYKRRAA